MKTKTETRMEKALHKIAEKIYWNFDANFGYSFQGSPLTMFVYDFDKDTFHEKEVLKIKIWNDRFQVFKRQSTGNYRRLTYTSEADVLYSYIKKACNV